MMASELRLNNHVTEFLDNLNHPFREEIEALRIIILSSVDKLLESIKWNGPNYSFNGEDRITIKIQPPKMIQLIFHRGAKVQQQPDSRLITDNSGIIHWKENDRAVVTFKTSAEIANKKEALILVIRDWISSTT